MALVTGLKGFVTGYTGAILAVQEIPLTMDT